MYRDNSLWAINVFTVQLLRYIFGTLHKLRLVDGCVKVSNAIPVIGLKACGIVGYRGCHSFYTIGSQMAVMFVSVKRWPRFTRRKIPGTNFC
jgi:hypothetical protein